MNQQAMLRKMRQLQKEMMETQKQIEDTLFTASCFPVTGEMLGSRSGFKVTIDKSFEIEDADDQETLEDAIAVVVNQLLNDIDKMTEEKMSKYQAMAGLF